MVKQIEKKPNRTPERFILDFKDAAKESNINWLNHYYFKALAHLAESDHIKQKAEANKLVKKLAEQQGKNVDEVKQGLAELALHREAITTLIHTITNEMQLTVNNGDYARTLIDESIEIIKNFGTLRTGKFIALDASSHDDELLTTVVF